MVVLAVLSFQQSLFNNKSCNKWVFFLALHTVVSYLSCLCCLIAAVRNAVIVMLSWLTFPGSTVMAAPVPNRRVFGRSSAQLSLSFSAVQSCPVFPAVLVLSWLSCKCQNVNCNIFSSYFWRQHRVKSFDLEYGWRSKLPQVFFYFYSYIFLGVFVYMYLCRPSEASTRYCVIPGGYPPQDWQSLPCAGRNPGLLICSQVHYHWATSPPQLSHLSSSLSYLSSSKLQVARTW